MTEFASDHLKELRENQSVVSTLMKTLTLDHIRQCSESQSGYQGVDAGIETLNTGAQNSASSTPLIRG